MLVWTGCDDSEEQPEVDEAQDIATGGPSDEDGEPPSAEADCEGAGPCADGGLCDVYDCGGRPARFNHFGCARVGCDSDSDCPSGEACFALAFDRSCEPSETTCFEEDGACVCEADDDCSGILDAHCLPTEFYPTEEYCDPSAWPCMELPSWIEALEAAADARAGTPLADDLAACAEDAAAALEACP